MSRTLVCLMALAMALPAQQTLVVSPSGPFTEIVAAINTAKPGDTILVRAGQYQNFTVSKPLRILADPGVTLQGSRSATFQVRDLPAGAPVVIRGIALADVSAFFPASIILSGCAGPVHLENITMTGRYVFTQVFDCAQVSLHRSTLGTVHTSDSNVLCTDTQAFGLAASSVGPGDPALRIDNSRVVVAGGNFRGGDGHPFAPTPPGPGIRLESGRLVLTGDASTVVASGTPTTGTSIAVSAIDSAAGAILLDPGPTLVPGGGAPPIAGGALVTASAVPALTVHVAAPTMTTTLRGPGGDHAFVLASPIGPPLPFPTLDLWVGVGHIVIGQGPIPATGVLTGSVNLPPLFPGTTSPVQAVVLSGGQLQLSNPVMTRWD
ncbi:MAG: hypothetical protein AAF628_37615 [Planctomycetota bacterium]